MRSRPAVVNASGKYMTSLPGERAKRRVHVVETVVRKLERHGVLPEYIPDVSPRGGIRARAIAHPEQPRVSSQTQSPAPSSTILSGSFSIAITRPRSFSLLKAASKCGSSRCRSGWRKRAESTLPSSTTAALAVKTRSGRPAAAERVRRCAEPGQGRVQSLPLDARPHGRALLACPALPGSSTD